MGDGCTLHIDRLSIGHQAEDAVHLLHAVHEPIASCYDASMYAHRSLQRLRFRHQFCWSDETLWQPLHLTVGIVGSTIDVVVAASSRHDDIHHFHLAAASASHTGGNDQLWKSVSDKDVSAYSCIDLAHAALQQSDMMGTGSAEGSQGQHKSMTIALKLAIYLLLQHKNNGTKPILLLDDIFDKLDANRVENIVGLVAGEDFGQIFITDTNRTHIDKILTKVDSHYQLFNVKQGHITPIDC